MQNRIRRVLVICSSYDFFTLEEDGRIDEHISMNMFRSIFDIRQSSCMPIQQKVHSPFSITTGSTSIIEIAQHRDSDTFELAKQVKEKYPLIPL